MWNLLLELKELLSTVDAEPEFVSVSLHQSDPSFRINQALQEESFRIEFSAQESAGPLRFRCSAPFEVTTTGNLSSGHDWQLLKDYLPYAVLPVFARKHQKCMTITHFAQTLDGRISTSNGQSKWIGNQENLVHAHRMRALCDGILVGSETVRRDKPQLTVRHVQGHDPVKIFVGDLNHEDLAHITGSAFLINDRPANGLNGSIGHIQLRKKDQAIDPAEILKELYRKGIHSVYIEGGSFTTSTFLKHRGVDEVQVHLSPRIIGAGLTGFNLEGIASIENAIHFDHYRFLRVGTEMMFVGVPVYV